MSSAPLLAEQCGKFPVSSKATGLTAQLPRKSNAAASCLQPSARQQHIKGREHVQGLRQPYTLRLRALGLQKSPWELQWMAGSCVQSPAVQPGHGPVTEMQGQPVPIHTGVYRHLRHTKGSH